MSTQSAIPASQEAPDTALTTNSGTRSNVLNTKSCSPTTRTNGPLIPIYSLSMKNCLSQRSRLDDDFMWCQNRNCEFGQLHSIGQSQPIAKYLRCGFRYCFKHSMPWDDRLMCNKYDEMLKHPDGFKSALKEEGNGNRRNGGMGNWKE